MHVHMCMYTFICMYHVCMHTHANMHKCTHKYIPTIYMTVKLQC